MTKYKVIFHLHDEKRGTTAFSNMVNLIKDLGEENLDIELLMNGTGVKIMLKDGDYVNKVDYLFDKGVVFSVCSNSLEGLKIPESDLLEKMKIVPSSVGELVKKQNEDWNYIKI
ncbi:MAG: DsrE family protein [Candidatus Thermoplasmatota archaeon]|nr:DsrE family protein [Candidatus Thermoplasmatota archaeon]